MVEPHVFRIDIRRDAVLGVRRVTSSPLRRPTRVAQHGAALLAAVAATGQQLVNLGQRYGGDPTKDLPAAAPSRTHVGVHVRTLAPTLRQTVSGNAAS